MKNHVKIIIILLGLILCFLVFSTVQSVSYKARINDNMRELLYIKKAIPWSEITDRESRYYDLMIQIFNHFSWQYDPKYVRAMSKEQKTTYMRLNYRLAVAFDFPIFCVPVIHQMESCFNPYAPHAYGEIGIGGFKWDTAVLAAKLIEYMPPAYRELLKCDVKVPEDLHDPIISLKLTYALLWYLRRVYRGREEWYILVYHWGGFLARHWDNGDGNIPVNFTLDGKKYDVFIYFQTYKSMLEAYESGELEPSRVIAEKWEAYRSKMVKEEIDYRETKSIIRRLRRELEEKKEIEQKLAKKYKDIEIALSKANDDLQRIARDSQVKGKPALRKVKDTIKKLMKQVWGDKKSGKK